MIYRGNKGKYISQYSSLGEHGEKILFHGTNGDNLAGILGDDFRLTTKPVHGAILGKGIYFTNDIEKAIYYSERGKETKYVIVCIVHVGDICIGNPNMNIHPEIIGKDKTYDTSVDKLNSPKQFVKKKNGTYNILVIITIEKYSENRSNTLDSSFKLINKHPHSITLYWVPDNIVSAPNWIDNVELNYCKKLAIVPAMKSNPRRNGVIKDHPGISGQLCMRGHTFICVMNFANFNWDPQSNAAIIRVFKSRRRGELIII